MAWRLAKSLVQLRAQVNALAPRRRKDSDGTIGDARHRRSRSEHNPDANGIVRAMDITHDPKRGMDSYALAETLRRNRDLRILYVISNGRIFSSIVEPWQWRRYGGINPHDEHMHVSVVANPARYDSTAPWKLHWKQAPPSRHMNITATVFGGPGDRQPSAYGGMVDPDKPGVALPARIEGRRPKVRVFRGDKHVDCEIVDVGPWTTDDA
jgi:hypothetical protein